MKPSQAAELVAVLIATYPWVPTTSATSAAYERGLIDLDYTLANAAVERVTATHVYANRLPTIAEIREAALTLVQGEIRTGLEAWGDVEKLMRRGFSSHRAPRAEDVADAIVFACIRDVGWRVLCMSSEEDSSPRARFIDSYDARASRERRTTLTASLPAVRRMQELRAGEAEQHERIAATTAPVTRALLELAAHPGAQDDPDAQRAIREAQRELRRRGEPVLGVTALGDLVGGVLRRGGGR